MTNVNYCYHYSQGVENANVPLLHTDEDDFQVLDLLVCHADSLAKVLYCGRLRESNGHRVDSAHALQSMFGFVAQKSLEMICAGRKVYEVYQLSKLESLGKIRFILPVSQEKRVNKRGSFFHRGPPCSGAELGIFVISVMAIRGSITEILRQ